MHSCNQCGTTFTRGNNLTRHKKYRCKYQPTFLEVIATNICEKKPGDKRPHCDEIIHFDSDEFEHGKPKSIETLNKLDSLVNKEVPPPEKKIGMGFATDIPSPAIGYVDASVPGVPGHQQQPPHDEIKEMLKPIPPPIIADKAPSQEDVAPPTKIPVYLLNKYNMMMMRLSPVKV